MLILCAIFTWKTINRQVLEIGIEDAEKDVNSNPCFTGGRINIDDSKFSGFVGFWGVISMSITCLSHS